MADYHTPTVIQQTISEADMTPLERMLLSHIFEFERDGDGWYFYSESGPVDMITIELAALEAALAASPFDVNSMANNFVTKLLADLENEKLQNGYLDIDLSITSWEFIFQDIVRRSSTLKYVSAVSSFTCSRMRADGFGGAVVVISADTILGKSTNDLLEEFIEQATASSHDRSIVRRVKRRSVPGELSSIAPFRRTAPAA